MRNYIHSVSILVGIPGLLLMGCTVKQPVLDAPVPPLPLSMIDQIDSFNPEVTCSQALDVINNNPYDQAFFEKVFARVVSQCMNCKSPANANIIWDHFVAPLKESGKVPPDLAKTTWNYYFSRTFVSLPALGPVSQYCGRLEEIKKSLEKEYRLKKLGFEITQQGNPDAHFLNAMYVYNTMWACCHDTGQ